MSKVLFPEFNIDYISNVMSLRKPQKQSIRILDTILQDIELSKNINLEEARENIKDIYPIFQDFEHPFMSLTFALATGVGKTKLMGTFITYLYTQKGVRNFFIVAPNLTIYEKLKNDLGNYSPDNSKYVFRGVSCFAVEHPNIWMDDDYKNRPPKLLTDSESINIYIFNISKFNSEERSMKDINEYLGQSFFNYLQGLEDLVIIMDESHHYRANKSINAINDLNPVLGLELTATPQVEQGNKTVLFKNVVYEYPLYKAIKDGYTRTPYALTRKDIKAYNLDEEELDKTMINDGITHHEIIKNELYKYSINNNKKLVKPFMLVVCKNTTHAEWVLNYIKSDEFMSGSYKDKVIMVHSNQKGAEKEENIRLLLDVEKTDNPIEIVVHVNILKEGWDVNNLYTIVPLRTATSKTLREQTVGRGLRLPFGTRTGDKLVDSVTITAHDKFDEIIAEARKENSIFNAEGVIYADYQERQKVSVVQGSIFDDDDKQSQVLTQSGLDSNDEENKKAYVEVTNIITNITSKEIAKDPNKPVNVNEIKNKVKEDIGKRYNDNKDIQKIVETLFGVNDNNDNIVEKIQKTEMFLPKLRTENIGEERYIIEEFDLDLTDMSYVPIKNELMRQNMLNSFEKTEVLATKGLDYNTIKPEKYLVDEIRQISEIDYEKCPKLIQKIVMQFLTYYREKYSEEDVRNICVMFRKDILNRFRDQLNKHLAVEYDGLIEEAFGIETMIRTYAIDYSHGIKNIMEAPENNISSYAYNGAKKSVTNMFKFDSNPERLFALVCENSPEVIQWLRPAPRQFNITYNRGKRYEPDFVVETNDMYYIVEIKSTKEIDSPDVIAKKERAVKYCKIASEYNKAHNHKEFKHIFIPHDEIASNISFDNLKDRFIVNK